MLTQQEVFDKVVDRLRDGTGRAINVYNLGNIRCAYLNDAGLKCAVGVLIPDGHPAQKFQGPIEDLIIKYGRELPPEIVEYERLLIKLQRVHDNQRCWTKEVNRVQVETNNLNSVGESALRYLAKEFNLNYKE